MHNQKHPGNWPRLFSQKYQIFDPDFSWESAPAGWGGRSLRLIIRIWNPIIFCPYTRRIPA